ncbi:hypothetical protein GIB67_028671 [Kingdonia uniflora]|uniref:Aminotransferase-like plant mobile domain-containing protein n=1 Tax=Kingdonia uniflora TaxID=39325 RepID=A0A7J7MTU8_9MAGN|nr:hypothetical protein GIB67_028671 [Kingdonia uniflora]
MDIRLGNSDNRLIQAFVERWWPTTYTFLFPCAEIGVTPLDFTMLTSLSIGRYLIQVPYDDAWSILSNRRQFLPNIDSSHIKSGNISIAHLMTYLSDEADREDDITIARAFIFFMMGHLWFQTANDAVPLGYLAAYWFYEYCGVGHPIVKKEVKYPAYPRLRAWERGNRKKTNDQAANLFIIGKYHIDHRTVETITWEPWFDSTVSETEDVLIVKLLSRKRIPLQVPNGNCEYYLGDRCRRQVTGEVCIPLDPLLSMSPHISPAALHETRQAGFVDCEQFERMGNLDLLGPSALRAGITPVVVTSASVPSLSQDFSLPGEAEGTDLGWHMEWTGRHERLPIARLRDPPPMSSSYGAKQLWHLTHDLQLRRGSDVWVVPQPPGEGAMTRQRGSGPRTRGGSTSRRGRGTEDDSK